jgi:hypothetical protein
MYTISGKDSPRENLATKFIYIIPGIICITYIMMQPDTKKHSSIIG